MCGSCGCKDKDDKQTKVCDGCGKEECDCD